MGFEVVDFVPTTRRWYDRGKPREMQGKWDACQSLSLRMCRKTKVLWHILFAPNSKNKSSMWNLHSVLGVQKSAHATWTELLWKFFNFSWLRCHFLGRTGLKPSVFPLHPQLLQVKGQSQKEHFCSYIGLSCGKKAAEPKVVF